MQRMLYPVSPTDRGATAVEYALMAALIALIIVGAVTALGLSLEALFTDEQLTNALGTG